nr:hypothetical protein [Vibrio furnissii]
MPHQVAMVKPSKTQLKVLNSIKVGAKVTAALIALLCELSECWASTLRKRPCEKHYLQRTGGVRQCGGVEFSYQMSFN